MTLEFIKTLLKLGAWKRGGAERRRLHSEMVGGMFDEQERILILDHGKSAEQIGVTDEMLLINEATLPLLLELVVLCSDVKTALDPTCDLTNISQLIYVNKEHVHITTRQRKTFLNQGRNLSRFIN